MNPVRPLTSLSLRLRVLLGSVLPAAGLLPSESWAQKIDCVQPPEEAGSCRAQLDTGRAHKKLVVQVLGKSGQPRAGDTVFFKVTRGAGTIAEWAVAAQNGLAAGNWHPRSPADTSVIEAAVSVDGYRASVLLTILPRPANPPTQWRLGKLSNNGGAWYVDRQLPNPVGVQIVGPDPTQCRNVRVRFRALTEGSGAAPDTASGVYSDSGPKLGCYAETHWRLGKEVGNQVLQANLVGEPAKRTQFSARARNLPRLMAGVALSRLSRYDRLVDSSRTVRVTRTQGAGTPSTEQIAFDTVVRVDSSKHTDYLHTTPIIGIDWAPRLGWTWLRTFVGVSPTKARDEWVVGLSGLQLPGGQRESVPFDLQVVLHFQRREEVTNPAVCGRGNPRGVCTTRRGRMWPPAGFGAVLSFDSFAALSQLLAAFPLR